MKLTDEMLRQHAEQARDIWLDTLPGDDEIPEHHFSDEFMASFKSMKAQERIPRRKKGAGSLRRVAAVFLTVLIGSGMWLGTNAESRAALIRWFREFREDYVVYTYEGEMPERDIGSYACTWLPDGMEVVDMDVSDTSGYVVYTSENDGFAVLSYNYMHSGTAAYLFPSEEKELIHSELELNGMHADIYEESGEKNSCFIIWFDETNQISFDINGNLSREEIIRMAESVQKNK